MGSVIFALYAQELIDLKNTRNLPPQISSPLLEVLALQVRA